MDEEEGAILSRLNEKKCRVSIEIQLSVKTRSPGMNYNNLQDSLWKYMTKIIFSTILTNVNKKALNYWRVNNNERKTSKYCSCR